MAEKAFGNVGGTFDAELVLASAKSPKGFLWRLGPVELDLPLKAPAEPDAYDITFHALPDYDRNDYSQPGKGPSPTISYGFVIATLAPFLLLVLGVSDDVRVAGPTECSSCLTCPHSQWLRLDANIANFPWSDWSRLPIALGFQICIAAILGLYGAFWNRLNIFQLIKILLPLLLVTLIVGQKALLQASHTKPAGPN
jgi:oligosaccharyltransferase complex subunit delta (ribophorin II)